MNDLENKGDASGHLVAAIGRAGVVVTIEHTKVVADVDAELVHNLDTEAAAKQDVEAVEAGILLIAVIGALVASQGASHFRDDTDGEARARISEETEIRSQVKTIAEGKGNVEEMILTLAAHRGDDQVGGIALGGIAVVETRSEVDAGSDGNGVAETDVETAQRVGISRVAGLDNVNGVEITGADGRLCENGSAGEQHSCGKNDR